MLSIIIPIFEPPNLLKKSIGILDIIKNKSIFAWSLEHLEKYSGKKRYYIISTDKLISETHIDKIIKLYTHSEVDVVRLQKNTAGAPCAVLMGIDKYDLRDEFLITSPDQFIDTDLNIHIDYFHKEESDGGTIGFKSIHSKWSYADLNKNNLITRIAEKVPISNNALTSTYYFKNGKMMIDALSQNILRGELTNDKYYIAPSFNELIIKNYKISYSKISSEKYYNFYSDDIKKDFINYLNSKEEILVKLTLKYFEYLKNKKFSDLRSLLSEKIIIKNSAGDDVCGISETLRYLEKKFSEKNKIITLHKISKNDDESTYCSYSLIFEENSYECIDQIHFNNISNKILKISRFSLIENEKI